MKQEIHTVTIQGLPFKEWWGKRPYAGHYVSKRAGTNKFFKRQLHKVERQQGVSDIENQLTEPDRDEDIIFELMIWD